MLAPTHDIAYTNIAPQDFFFHPDDVTDGACWVLFDPSGEPQADVYLDEGLNALRFATRFGPPEAASMVWGQEVARFTGTAGQNLQGLAWTTWTPTYTGITVGNGTVVARYVRIGDTVIAQWELTFGSTTSVSTGMRVSAPVAPSTAWGAAPDNALGRCHFFDAGGGRAHGYVRIENTTELRPILYSVSGSFIAQTSPTDTVPWTWATGDRISFTCTYEAA